MGQFKGTKGKWKVQHSISKDAFNIVGTVVGGNYKIARIPYLVIGNVIKVNDREKAEADANAKLIAAAPELLEALLASKAVFEALGIYANHRIAGEQYDKVVEAIKKATE